MDNSSTIFGSNVMGGRDKTPEEILQEEQIQQQKQSLIQEDTLLQALQPINFEEKIMGGQKSKNFMMGKLSPMDDSFSYADKVNKLTGKGTMTGLGIDELVPKGKHMFTMPELNLGTNKNKENMLNFSTTKNKKQFDFGLKQTKQKNTPYKSLDFNTKMKEVFSMKPINPFKNNTQNNQHTKIKQDKQSKNKIDEMLGMKQTNNNINNVIYGLTGTQRISQINNANANLALNKIRQGLGYLNLGPKNQDINNLIYGYNTGNHTRAVTQITKNNALNKIRDSFGVFNTAVGSQKINEILGNIPNPETQAIQRIRGQQATINPLNILDTKNIVSNILYNKPRRDTWSMNQEEDQESTTYYEPQYGDDPYETQPIALQGLNTIRGDRGLPPRFPTTDEDKTDYIENSLIALNQRLQDPTLTTKQRETTAKAMTELKRIQRLEQEAKQKGNLQEQQRLRAIAEQEMKKELGLKELETRKELQERELGYKESKDVRTGERETEKLKAQTGLEREKLRLQAQKGDVQLWESKLKAGANQVDTLLGGSGRNITTPSTIVGGGADPYKMAMLTATGTPTPTFSQKVGESVGAPTQEKSFTQKVYESVSMNKQPEEAMELPQPQVITPQPVQQAPVQVPQYEPQPQQYQQYPQTPQYPQYQPQPQVDWGKLKPEEAARYDPEYAKYLAESEEEVEYRRGPYKTRK